ncbi:MAG: protein kinase, partial [Kofleriaceae bacterium]|nr:protein kinase [Kofleriaceae bacterium]
MTGSADGAADSLIGTLVADRYMVEAHLDEGGMGSVYRARHVTLDKLVALKVLHAEFSRKEDFVRRFLLEAKAASRIRNQHVIDITDFGTTDEGYVFFSMEFLAGKDLHSLLGTTLADGGLLPWDRACGIFLQICE